MSRSEPVPGSSPVHRRHFFRRYALVFVLLSLFSLLALLLATLLTREKWLPGALQWYARKHMQMRLSVGQCETAPGILRLKDIHAGSIHSKADALIIGRKTLRYRSLWNLLQGKATDIYLENVHINQQEALALGNQVQTLLGGVATKRAEPATGAYQQARDYAPNTFRIRNLQIRQEDRLLLLVHQLHAHRSLLANGDIRFRAQIDAEPPAVLFPYIPQQTRLKGEVSFIVTPKDEMRIEDFSTNLGELLSVRQQNTSRPFATESVKLDLSMSKIRLTPLLQYAGIPLPGQIEEYLLPGTIHIDRSTGNGATQISGQAGWALERWMDFLPGWEMTGLQDQTSSSLRLTGKNEPLHLRHQDNLKVESLKSPLGTIEDIALQMHTRASYGNHQLQWNTHSRLNTNATPSYSTQAGDWSSTGEWTGLHDGRTSITQMRFALANRLEGREQAFLFPLSGRVRLSHPAGRETSSMDVVSSGSAFGGDWSLGGHLGLSRKALFPVGKASLALTGARLGLWKHFIALYGMHVPLAPEGRLSFQAELQAPPSGLLQGNLKGAIESFALKYPRARFLPPTPRILQFAASVESNAQLPSTLKITQSQLRLGELALIEAQGQLSRQADMLSLSAQPVVTLPDLSPWAQNLNASFPLALAGQAATSGSLLLEQTNQALQGLYQGDVRLSSLSLSASPDQGHMQARASALQWKGQATFTSNTLAMQGRLTGEHLRFSALLPESPSSLTLSLESPAGALDGQWLPGKRRLGGRFSTSVKALSAETPWARLISRAPLQAHFKNLRLTSDGAFHAQAVLQPFAFHLNQTRWRSHRFGDWTANLSGSTDLLQGAQTRVEKINAHLDIDALLSLSLQEGNLTLNPRSTGWLPSQARGDAAIRIQNLEALIHRASQTLQNLGDGPLATTGTLQTARVLSHLRCTTGTQQHHLNDLLFTPTRIAFDYIGNVALPALEWLDPKKQIPLVQLEGIASESNGHFQWQRDTLPEGSLNLDCTLSTLTAAGAVATRARASLRVSSRTLELDVPAFTAYQGIGNLTGKGSIEKEGLFLSCRGMIRDLDLADFAAHYPMKDVRMAGIVDMEFHLFLENGEIELDSRLLQKSEKVYLDRATTWFLFVQLPALLRLDQFLLRGVIDILQERYGLGDMVDFDQFDAFCSYNSREKIYRLQFELENSWIRFPLRMNVEEAAVAAYLLEKQRMQSEMKNRGD